jgi:hypothetical protein
MEAPVDLEISVHRSSPLALHRDPGAEEAAHAERLGRELASLEPRIRLTVTDDGAGDVPILTVAGRIRFVGVPRVNLFRALLETVRRVSTGDHGLPEGWAQALATLPRPVHAQVFATPT